MGFTFVFRNNFLVTAILAVTSWRISAGQRSSVVSAGLQVQQTCGPQLLSQKGIQSDWSPAMQFDQNQIFITPKKPRIPGCFNLTALNVTIARDLKRGLTAEFEMRIGKVPDINLPKLKCKSQLSDCGCGTNNSCMFCDFCSHIKQHVSNLEDRETQLSAEKSRQHKFTDRKTYDSCECEIEAGIYDIRAEICTPTSNELETVLPAAVLALVNQKTTFTLWTTVNMYDLRFQVINNQLADEKVRKRFYETLTRNHLIGCHVIGTDIEVPF